MRVQGTNLRQNPNDGNRYRMQFAELEVYNSPHFKLVNKLQNTVIRTTDETFNNVTGVFHVAAVPITWSDDAMAWSLQPDGNGYYKIVNKLQNTAIQITNEPYNNNPGVKQLVAVPISWTGDDVLWQAQAAGNGYYKLVNKAQGTIIQTTGEIYNNGVGVYNLAAVPGNWTGDGLLWRLVSP